MRYIDAIYDLYFFLETLFADGTFKKKVVVLKFSASKELLEAINQDQKDIDPEIRSNPNSLKNTSTRIIDVLFKQERVDEFLKTAVKAEDGRTIRWGVRNSCAISDTHFFWGFRWDSGDTIPNY